MAFEDLLVKIVSQLDEAGFKRLDNLERRADRQTRILSNSLRNMFVGVVGGFGAKEIIDASVKLDSLKTSFAALAGSDIEGAKQLEYLRNETQRLGQDFLTSAEAYKNLFSAGRGTNMSAEEIQNIFSAVLEAGTVLGSSQQQMQGALLALEQMISKGKVSMEELRRQLGNALPGAMQIAARAMGTTSQGLQEMLESGLDSQKFVTAFGDQLHKEFGDKATKAAHTLRAELARLNNEIFNLKTSFLDGEAGEAFADTIRQLVLVLKSPELKGSLQGISQFLTFLLKNIKPLMVIFGLLLGNMAVGKAASGIAGALGMLGGGAKTILALRDLTAGPLRFFPRVLKILNLVWWALSPIKKIELGIWAVIAVITAIAAAIKAYQKWQQNREKPIWVKDENGEWRDVNETSPTYGQKGILFDQKQVEALRAVGNDILFTPIGDNSGKVTDNPAPIGANEKSKGLSSQKIIRNGDFGNIGNMGKRRWIDDIKNISINISTRHDNPQGIGEAVRMVMADILETARIDNGYRRTEVV